MKRATVVLVACVAIIAMAGLGLAGHIFEPTISRSNSVLDEANICAAKTVVKDDIEVKHGGMFPIECIWGTTYAPRSNNTGQEGSIPEEGDMTLPVTDPNYDSNPAVIDWPFSLDGTAWLDADQGRTAGQEISFVGYEANDHYTGTIWAMNDETYLFIALELDKAPVASTADSSIEFYFDPDHYTDAGDAHFITDSAFMVSFDIDDTGAVVAQRSGHCTGNWDKNAGGQYPPCWPNYFEVSAGIDYAAGFAPNMAVEGDARKTGRWHFQMRVPIEYLGCATPLGSTLGFAVCYIDDENADGDIDESGAGSEELWWPVDIADTGDCQEEGWDVTDAMYMGNLILSYRGTGSLCWGDRLWGVYFDLTELDETTWLVLKNASDYTQTTSVKFYESDYSFGFNEQQGTVTSFSNGPKAGLIIAKASMCINIPAHGVYVLNLRDVADRDTGDPGALINLIGTVEVSNPNLYGYMAHMKGITTGIHASSVNLLGNPASPAEYYEMWPNVEEPDHALLSCNYYTVAQADNYSTKIAIFNPSCCYDAEIVLNAYEWPGTQYQGTDYPSAANIITEYDEVCIPPHQTLVFDLATLLSSTIAGDPLYRRGSVEIVVGDGSDELTDAMNEILIGTTWRYSGTQSYSDAMRVYYLGHGETGD
ncbi:MAG: hypothetical protein JW941_09020 [Candidatus Coatesbacteria bacterium]|nr:hypothetical protein [Candidatus Coatesbacteria bacterium]